MGEATAGVGHFLIPTAPAAGTAVAQSASANTYGTKTNIGGAALGAQFITGVYVEVIAGANLPTYVSVQLYVTASTVIDTMNVPLGPTSGVASTQWAVYKPIYPPIPVAASTQILAATASSVASAISYLVTLECILQSNVVDDGIAVATVTTVTNQLTAAAVASGVWKDTVSGDFTVASSIGKSLYTTGATPGAANGLQIAGANAATTYATLTSTGAFSINGVSDVAQTGDSFARIGAAGAGLTGVTGVTLAASQHVIVDSGVVTTLTNLPAITAGWLTATGIAASALNGKGDWNIGKTGYSLTQTFPANFAARVISAAGVADANIKSVAGTTVNGSGTAASPWGP